MQHCFNCGAELPPYLGNLHYQEDRFATCGLQECEREARYAAEQERAEAHEQLDRDIGW